MFLHLVEHVASLADDLVCFTRGVYGIFPVDGVQTVLYVVVIYACS